MFVCVCVCVCLCLCVCACTCFHVCVGMGSFVVTSLSLSYTTFTLTRFGSVISSGMVTKRSVNRAEPCRTDPGWDLLTEPGQHGSVRLFGECEHFYNRAEFVIVSGEVLLVSYERFLLQRYDRQRVDRQRSALPH